MNVVVQSIDERLSFSKNQVAKAKLDATYYVDTMKNGCLHSFGEMLNNFPTNEYRLHLQDDIIFADNFKFYLPILENIMQQKEIHVLSLFAPNRKLIIEQYNKGMQIAPFPNYLWLQASVFSPQFQYYLKHEFNNLENADIKDDDVFVAYVMKKYGVKAYVHLPSLVQHDTSIKSSLGHANSKNRESKVFDKDFITKKLYSEL